MIIFLNKLKEIKLVGLFFVIFLVACTSNQRYKRQINDNESYLNTSSLKKLTIPQGISLPLENGEYNIPIVNQTGPVGKNLDIRPPIQILSLLENSYTKNSLIASTLFLNNTIQNKSLWSQIKSILQQKTIKIIQEQENNFERFLLTDWITWLRGDEDIPFQTRHKIKFEEQNNQIIITVTNEGIKQGKKKIADVLEIHRYNSLMLNDLIYGINKLYDTSINYNVE